MSQTFTSVTGIRCPKCGGELGGFPPDHTCAGIRCLSCDYVSAVTTNQNVPPFDRTPYDVWVDAGTKDRMSIIAAVGNALCIGVAAARQLIDAGSPVAKGIQALEVQRLAKLFRGLGLGIRIRPEFRWPLE
jgi:hypothetical protein